MTPTLPITVGVTLDMGEAFPVGAFNPASLFAGGELGFVYNAGNSATVWTDTSGTTPAAINDLDARIDDTSGNAANATQASSGLRPVVSARVNLLTKTEDYADSAWGKAALNGAFSTGIISPSGANLPRYTENAAAGVQRAMYQLITLPHAGTITISMEAKQEGRRYLSLYPQAGVSPWAIFDLVSGVVSLTGGSGYVSSSITALGSGVFRCSITATYTSGAVYSNIYWLLDASEPASAYDGDGVSGSYVGAMQFEYGSTATTYQPVNTATDYDTIGFPVYLDFDNVDDKLTATLPDLGTDATVAYCTPYAAPTFLTAQTIGAGAYDITTDFCARFAIDRALTVDETADLTAWLNTQSGYTP